jgi:hypothetical protein
MHRFIPLTAILLATTVFAGPPRTGILQVQNTTCETCPIVCAKPCNACPA